MKIIMLVSQQGPNVSRNCGDLVDVDADEAKRLIDAGFAKPERSKSSKVEKAVK